MGNVGTKVYVKDSNGCLDSASVLIEEEHFPKVDWVDILNCDATNASIKLSHSRVLIPWEYSIDNGKSWQNGESFEQLSAGVYLPAVRKTSSGCILRGDTIQIGKGCQILPIASFKDSVIYITSTDQLLDVKWKIQGKPFFKQPVDLKIRLEGDGSPHFNQLISNSNLPQLRGNNDLQYPFHYINGLSRRDSFSLYMNDSARYYTYPIVYFFHLEKPIESAVSIDPKKDRLKVVVALNDPIVPETEKVVYLCPDQNCITIGQESPLGFCSKWQNEALGGNVCRPLNQQNEYIQYILNDKLEIVEIIHYKIIDVKFDVTIKPDANSIQVCQGTPLKLNAELNGLDPSNAIYLWSTGETSASITIQNPTDGRNITVKVTDKDSKCFVNASYQIKDSQRDAACKLYDYFTNNGFYKIKITIRKNPAVGSQPTLRADPCTSNECSGSTGVCVRDNSNGLKFELRGGLVESVASNVNDALNDFSTNFNYVNAKGLITENTQMCACNGGDGFLRSTEQNFKASELGYWLHIWEKGDSDCSDSDILFIKAKLPGDNRYSPGQETPVTFLDAGLDHLSNDLGLNDGKIVRSTMDLMLDNYAMPKDNIVFNNSIKRTLLPQNEIVTSCNVGFNALPVGSITLTGHVVQMPADIVTRFDLSPKLVGKVANGPLTGFTTFGGGKITGIYSGRYRLNTTYHVGYYAMGASSFTPQNSYPFSNPGTPPIRIYSGKAYNSIREIDHCKNLISIFQAEVVPKKSFEASPKGNMIEDILDAVDIDPFTRGMEINTYPICGDNFKSLLPGISSIDDIRAFIVFNDQTLGTGVMYHLKDSNYSWIYAQEVAGIMRYYTWNCYLASWMELPNGSVGQEAANEITILYDQLKDKNFTDAIHDILQTTALGISFICPVVGAIIEGADIVLYLFEGNVGNASLGVAGLAIGFAPQIGKAIKVVGGVLKWGDNVIGTFVKTKCIRFSGLTPGPELRSITAKTCLERLIEIFPKDLVTKLVSNFSKSSSDELTEEFLKLLEKADGAGDIFKLVEKNENNAGRLAKVWLEVKKIPELANNETKLIDLINDLSKNEQLLGYLAGFGGENSVKAWFLAADSGLDLLRVNPNFLKALRDHINLGGVPRFTQYGCSLVDEGLIRYYTTGASENLNLGH